MLSSAVSISHINNGCGNGNIVPSILLRDFKGKNPVSFLEGKD